MSIKYLALFAVVPLALSACSKVEDDGASGSGISIDLSDDDSSDAEKIKIGGEGDDSKFSIKADGFSMEVDLPDITLDSDDFDMNDVDLYPGSQIIGFDIEDKDGEGGEVRISFKAPTDAQKLAEWYEKRLVANDFEVARNETGLSGKTSDGDPFSLALSEMSGSESKGVLTFSERD